ncbi:MAG: flagellar basal body rod protein [Burkholderiales bacterium]|nr:flagellar basal body rod protein [Burkholderiales bacterium]
MNAAQAMLGASAANFANLSTPGYRREQVVQSTAASGAVSTTLSQATEPGDAIETDVVNRLVAKNQFLANLAVFKTGDSMTGALLDDMG